MKENLKPDKESVLLNLDQPTSSNLGKTFIMYLLK